MWYSLIWKLDVQGERHDHSNKFFLSNYKLNQSPHIISINKIKDTALS